MNAGCACWESQCKRCRCRRSRKPLEVRLRLTQQHDQAQHKQLTRATVLPPCEGTHTLKYLLGRSMTTHQLFMVPTVFLGSESVLPGCLSSSPFTSEEHWSSRTMTYRRSCTFVSWATWSCERGQSSCHCQLRCPMASTTDLLYQPAKVHSFYTQRQHQTSPHQQVQTHNLTALPSLIRTQSSNREVILQTHLTCSNPHLVPAKRESASGVNQSRCPGPNRTRNPRSLAPARPTKPCPFEA